MTFLGQEGATIDCDEGIPITPFNLSEEMQEGHFDSEGNYFIKKDELIKDNWLDNIDWVNAFFVILFNMDTSVCVCIYTVFVCV